MITTVNLVSLSSITHTVFFLMRTSKTYSLKTFKYEVQCINYSHQAIHFIPRTCLFYD